MEIGFLLLNVNGTSGFYGNRIFVNPANCNGDLAVYYKSTNTSDYAVVCNDTTEITLIPNNLVSYWKFDETSAGAVVDSIGNNNGTNDGADINQVGKIERAYDFVRANTDSVSADGVDLGDSFSISVWIKVPAISGEYAIFSNGEEETGVYNSQHIRVRDPGTVRFQFEMSSSNSNAIEYTTGDTVDDNAWHLITITRAAATRPKIYIDGTEQTSGLQETSSDWSGTVVYDTLESIYIGKMVYNSANYHYTNGLIDELELWNRTLSSAEVITSYNNTKDNFNNMLLGAEESAPPTNTAPSIISNITKPDTVYTNTDWKLNITAIDTENASFTAYTQFYINGESSGGEASHSIENNSNTNVANLSSSSFNAGDKLIAEMWAGDNIDNSTKTNSSEITVSYFVMGGTVKDSSNIVINNAKVIIIDQSDNTITGTTDSNSTGGWTYNIGSTGTYLVVAYDPNNSTRDGDADPHIVVS